MCLFFTIYRHMLVFLNLFHHFSSRVSFSDLGLTKNPVQLDRVCGLFRH